MTEDKNASEPQSSKPAWFALVDSDAPSAQVVKVNKKLPVIALIVTGAIAASGTFFASASDKSHSSSTSIPSVTTTVTSASTSSTSSSVTSTKTAATVKVISHTVQTPKKTAVQNPSQGGVQAPRGGGDDDDENDDDEREDRD